jgi:PAS domain S-box-containing protein
MSDLHTEIVNTTHALIIVLDAKGRIVMFNPACERASGYRFEEVKGRLVWDFLLLPEEIEGVRIVFADLRVGRSPNTHENHWITKSGERRFIEWSNSAVTDETGRVTHVIGTGIDVTEKRVAEQALREMNHRKQALLDSMPDAAWLKDLNGTYIEVNRLFAERNHRDAREIIGKNDLELVGPEIARYRLDTDQEVIRTGQTVHSEHRIMAGGQEHWLDTIKAPVVDETGVMVGIAGIAHDITDRKHAEQMLHETQQRQKALLDSIPDAAWLKDAHGHFIEINRNYARRWGIDLSHIIGKTASEFFPAPIAAENAAEDHEIMRSAKPLHAERHLAIGGRDYWFDIIKTPITDATGNVTGIAGISRDITERKLAEARRMARDASLRAALVKEVHHRIKNNLQGVITLVETLATRHPENAQLLDAIITRISAVATVHGLYGSTNERELRLDQILLKLVSSLKVLYTDLPVYLSTRINSLSMRVMESEIVPLALVVNELIMNAVKHSDSVAQCAPVDISLENAHDHARIVVRNYAGRLPEQFNFDTGAGLGNGLVLVKSLLPSQGALLHFANAADGGVQAELTLRPPVITLAASET